MAGIEEVVEEICKICAGDGAPISEILAAFVAQSIIESNPSVFPMDQALKPADLDRLVTMSADRLREKDSPSLETIRMQVVFDSSYVKLEERLERRKESRTRKLRAIQKEVLAVQPRGNADFDALTSLYRQIFSYLLAYHEDETVPRDRTIEREVAAALESVFPRIGLKSFVHLTPDEKKSQLTEMARIVLGIRLFNREVGKGGAGLRNIEEEVYAQALEMRDALEAQAEAGQSLCLQYQETIVYANLRQPKNVPPAMVSRWKDELANRRQYLSYLQSLLEDVLVSVQRVQQDRDTFMRSIDDLQGMVGSKSSVPKEHVYPKFEASADAWMRLVDEAEVLKARQATLVELHNQNQTFHATLAEDSPILVAARAQMSQMADDEEDQAALALMEELGTDESADGHKAESKATGDDARAEGKDAAAKADSKDGAGASEHAEMPVKLSVESTPEFMQLPLEYQGFCPWTLANRHGLLLPGKPALGVVRYTNQFFVFTSTAALQAFMRNPDRYKQGVVEAAKQSPELINLLRLQEDFPRSAISHLLNPNESMPTPMEDGVAETKDAGTETPTHFVEKHIDVNYEWNEWALRRRALKMANLRKCATTSMQTDDSHFRRDNDSQVYLPKQQTTQTMRESGTQPPVIKQYVAGLRGMTSSSMPSRYANESNGKAGVVNLVLEPGASSGHMVVGGRSRVF